ncbi:MAG: hypothetical protein ABS904_00905 [Solibacillus isronensis]
MAETIIAVKNYKHIDKPTKKNVDHAVLEVSEQDIKILVREDGFYQELMNEINTFTQLHEELIESFLPSIYKIQFNNPECHRGSVSQWRYELWSCKEHIEFYDREIKMIDTDVCSGQLKWLIDQWNDGYQVIKVG